MGLAVALWSASGYVGAFMRASNVIYETPEGRPIWKLRPLQMLVTLVMVLLLAVVPLALVLTGPIVETVAGPSASAAPRSRSGTSPSGRCWPCSCSHVRHPLLRRRPNVKLRGFKWVTPGSLLALVVWLDRLGGFAFYVSNFGSYNKTYGTLGGIIAFLVWFWITNVAPCSAPNSTPNANAAAKSRRPTRAEREIQLEPRDEPKGQQTT